MEEKKLMEEKEQVQPQVAVEEQRVWNLEVGVIDETKLLVPVSYKDKLRVLLKNREEMYLELCKVCWSIKKNEVWKAEGANSIKEWFSDLEEEFDFSLQTFYGFARIGEFVEKHPYLSEEDLKGYGYSKLRELVIFCETVRLTDENLIKKLMESTKELSLREFRKRIEEIKTIKATAKKKKEKEEDVSLDSETLRHFREDEWSTGSSLDLEITEKEKMRSLKDELSFDREEEEVEARKVYEDEEERGGLLSDFGAVLERLEKGEKKSIILSYTDDIWEDIIQPVFEIVEFKTNIRDYSNAVLYVMYDFLYNHFDEFKLIRQTKK